MSTLQLRLRVLEAGGRSWHTAEVTCQLQHPHNRLNSQPHTAPQGQRSLRKAWSQHDVVI